MASIRRVGHLDGPSRIVLRTSGSRGMGRVRGRGYIPCIGSGNRHRVVCPSGLSNGLG